MDMLGLVLSYALGLKVEYFSDQLACLILGVAVMLFDRLKEFRWSFRLFATYTVANLAVTIVGDGFTSPHDYLVGFSMGLVSTVTFICALGMNQFDLKPALRWICLSNAMLCLFGLGNSFGFFDNPSISASFTMVLFPFLAPVEMVIAAASIFLVRHWYTSNLAAGLLLLYPCLFLYKYGKGWMKVLSTVSFFAGSLSRLIYHNHHYIDRPIVWGETIRAWAKGNWLLGSGVGSVAVLGPHWAQVDPGVVFTTVHNDFVQVLFERGLIGLVLFVWVFADALILSWRDNFREFLCLVGFAAFAFLVFPLEMPLVFFIWVLLLRKVLIAKNKSIRRYSKSGSSLSFCIFSLFENSRRQPTSELFLRRL